MERKLKMMLTLEASGATRECEGNAAWKINLLYPLYLAMNEILKLAFNYAM